MFNKILEKEKLFVLYVFACAKSFHNTAPQLSDKVVIVSRVSDKVAIVSRIRFQLVYLPF